MTIFSHVITACAYNKNAQNSIINFERNFIIMTHKVLTNIARATGFYQNFPTTLESIPLNTILLSALTIEKTADKRVWADGLLTYTITIQNSEIFPFSEVICTDILDPELIILIPDSVYINDVKSSYNYDPYSGLLEILLQNDIAHESVTITFCVEKR